jgi:serine/threonine protein kinase
MEEGPEIIISDFEKIKSAGSGASGEVWRARAKRELKFASAGQDLALKEYKADLLSEPNQRKRIAEEYATGSRLVHPNLVRIYHVDVAASPPYMVMEWCEGKNLLEWRQTTPEPSEEFLLQFATEILDAIEFLHSSRRMHRDIKPANIHVDVKGKIRLLDYGIIRSLREPHITQDNAGRFVGTYRYSAPEYILRDEFSYQADLYSFGAVLYYLLHGKEVFPNTHRTPDIISAKQSHNIIFESRLQGKGPIWSALFELSRKLLQREPALRPASALASLDLLAAAVPDDVPLRSYFACSLTRTDDIRKNRTEEVAKTLRTAADQQGFSLYLPGEHTHPLGAPNLSAPEVYWIDRERVASSDLLVIYGDEPSFGVGQEAEIAANAGVPIVIFWSSDVSVSRMLRGIAGRVIAEIVFSDDADLALKASDFFKRQKSRLRLSRKSREREYNLRLGNRVRDGRILAKLTTTELAEQSGVNKEMIEALAGC